MFNNFLNTVGNAAKTIGQAVEESNKNNQQGEQQDIEETVGKVDSKDGKVQVTTVQDHQEKKATEQQSGKGSDFLSGLLNVAQTVGKSLEEQQKQKAAKENEEETVGKIDSQGGKVQVNTIQDEKKAESSSKGADILSGLVQVVGNSLHDYQNKQQKEEKNEVPEVQGGAASKPAGDGGFLSGLANVASDIGNAIEKQKKEEEERKRKEKQEADMKALGDNISGFVGGLFKKDGEKKPEKPVEVTFKNEAVIDDIEGEIGKVTTSGYTSAVQKQ
ncbi:unnamed protein product [Caenorhabditis angaria]|uniref:Uncharacterized protein n=1 Tax=Caenorhabditis angaria TaxID=860376 RepID=A0A9P1IBU6_9PELO|nr:unnamed protein product [Caenorhabditis angaria]